MEISGKQFEQRLTQLAARWHAQASALEQRHGQTRAALEALLNERQNVLGRLASHYLPNLSPASRAQPFRELETQLERVWTSREARRLDLDQALARSAEQRRLDEQALAEITRRLDALVERRESLEAELTQRLADDADFRGLSESAAQAEAQLTQNEERSDELQREAREKLPAYEQDDLFQYLVKRRFGTGEYRSRGLVRRLDRWLAKLVKFDAQRRSYDFLRAAPALVEAEIERRQAEFATQMAAVEAHRDRLENELGLDPVRAAGYSVGAERDRLVELMGQRQIAAATLTKERAEIEAHRCRFYDEALEQTKAFLGRRGEAELAAHAASTPDPRDDALVIELERCALRVKELEGQLGGAVAEIKRDQQRALEIESLVQRYRLRNFDAGRSLLRSQPDAALGEYEAGRLSAEDLWRAIEAQQHFRPPALPVGQRPWSGSTGPFGAPGDPTLRGGRPDLFPRGRSPVAETVIDLVALALRHSMARSIGRRGAGGGWGVDLGFPGRIGLPPSRPGSRPSFPSSRSPSAPSRPSGGKSTGGGFSTRDGF
jgi:hypothetical protein